MGNNMQAFYDGMTLVGSLVVMVVVIVATYYASRWYAGRMSRTAAGRHIKILDRVTVSTGCSLVVVEAGGRFYLVGVSDKNMQMLGELTDFDPGVPDDAVNQAAFGQMLQGFLNKAKSHENPSGDGGEK